jgi:tetratricopeptide (TPR) repeat protein
VAEGLAELLRREVLVVTADPLSPERGSYVFAQELLRQVAYDTLSRRDRKARHLTVAAHLRRTFANDGEEVTDVVARHYLDAVEAVPDDADVDELRELAAQALVRAAERAERTGALQGASARYADAADLAAARGDRHTAAELRHRAANAAVVLGDNSRAVALAETAVRDFEELAESRAAARARTILGRALRRAARHAEAREVLTSALAVLRVDPDADTVTALEQLAGVENFAASPAAAAANIEALAVAEGLDSGPADLSAVLVTFGIYLTTANRSTEARMYYTRAGELAEQADNTELLGYALLNLANSQLMHDPAAAAVTLRRTRPVARRCGDRGMLGAASFNLTLALLDLGEWDEAADVVAVSADPALVDDPLLQLGAVYLSALRGDGDGAQHRFTRVAHYLDSEDPQERALATTAQTYISSAQARPADVLAQGRVALGYRDLLGISSDAIRLSWPMAARASVDLGDREATGELLAMLDAELPGRLSPLLRAERELVRARVAAARGDESAGQQLTSAVDTMRRSSPPHLLAAGLLDHAAYLLEHGDHAVAAVAAAEAREIGERLDCRPVLDRADLLKPLPAQRAEALAD